MDLTDLLSLCVKRHASDLHLRPGRVPALRILGTLLHLDIAAYEAASLERLLRAAIPPGSKSVFDRQGFCDFILNTADTRVRMHVFRHPQGMAAALRLIPLAPPKLADIGLPLPLTGITEARQGLILITGASGSGKSTTLAALIDHFNDSRACHILTLEDPIEYVHESRTALITQCETPRGNDSLRAALRQDPDILMIGEMRDTETLALALQAAETGHLVLSTLHTRTAADAIQRIVGAFSPGMQEEVRMQLSLSLRAVLTQTLVLGIHGDCRLPVHELMIVTPAIRNLIRENRLALIESQLQTGRQHGMYTLRQCLNGLVASGRVAHHEADRLLADWN
jgi:twitching motility protein PilT